jgi:hypothetical protein
MSINLTRRSLFARTAAVAVVAAAPAALAMPEEQQPVVAEAPAPIGPTRIERLWKKRQAAKREYDRLRKICRKLEAEVDRQMPAPHPSIMYGPEQEADGLKPAVPRIVEVDKFIRPLYIQGPLNRAKYGPIAALGQKMVDALDQCDEPVTEGEQAALVERLKTRLQLSQRYERKLRRVQEKVGVTAIRKKMDAACDLQTEIEWRISAAKPVTRADMARKFALYDYYDGEFHGEEILRDLRRLFQGQATLAA